jgi:hypothetical protein
MKTTVDASRAAHEPWNKGKLIGQWRALSKVTAPVEPVGLGFLPGSLSDTDHLGEGFTQQRAIAHFEHSARPTASRDRNQRFIVRYPVLGAAIRHKGVSSLTSPFIQAPSFGRPPPRRGP